VPAVPATSPQSQARSLPPVLRPGGTIGIVSPSAPSAARRPRRFRRGVAELRARGLQVLIGPCAQLAAEYAAGTPRERAADLHVMFGDPRVQAIMSATGGLNANHVLEELDFDLIAANPKLLIGYSDANVLQLAIWARTGVPGVMGPAVLPQFGEYGGVHPYTWDYFERAVMSVQAPGVIQPSPEWITERLDWDRADDRPRRGQPNPGPRWIRPGAVTAPVLPASMESLLVLAGTRFWPELEDVLLCLEPAEGHSKASMDRMLTQMRLLGIFEQIAGLAFGRLPPIDEFVASDLDELVLAATAGFDIPVAADLDFGHTDPIISLPFGVRARIDGDRQPVLALLEPCVAEPAP
jgi:muramoyltetrapeptide carboxypeptidase